MKKSNIILSQNFFKKLVITCGIFRLLNSRGVFFENPKWKERMGYNRSIS